MPSSHQFGNPWEESLSFPNSSETPVTERLPIHTDQRDAELLMAGSGLWVPAGSRVSPMRICPEVWAGRVLSQRKTRDLISEEKYGLWAGENHSSSV